MRTGQLSGLRKSESGPLTLGGRPDARPVVLEAGRWRKPVRRQTGRV